MGLRINHNTTAINAHRNLQANEAGMAKTLEKLSSGMKVNRASDGPAALVISEQMRAQIAGMNQAIDNSETSISMVQTAEANLAEVSSLLTSIRQLAIHAANEGVNDEKMLEADQKEINNALSTIARISAQAQFGNKRLLDGSNGANGTTTGQNLEFVGADLKTTDSSANGYEVRVTQSATQAKSSGSVEFTQDIVSQGETLTIIENGKKASYTTSTDDSIQTAVQNLRASVRENGLNVTVDVDENGVLEVKHKNYGSDYGFQISSSTAGVLSSEAGEIEVAEAGLDIRGKINGETATGKGQVLTGIRGAESTDGLSVKYTGELIQDIQAAEAVDPTQRVEETEEEIHDRDGDNIADSPEDIAIKEGRGPTGVATADELPPEASEGEVVGRVFVSQNSLKFQVGANTGQTVGISVSSSSPETLARGVDNESGFKNLAEVDVSDFQGAQDTIMMVDNAINQVAELRGDLGAFQKNTLESNMNNLRVANENLVNAESVLRDTDMAAEMANFTKTQIMAQSATAMLAQANQTPKNVLQLLG